MSLLMDALRKAEEEKKQAEKGSQATTESKTQADVKSSVADADADLQEKQSSSSIPDAKLEFEEPADNERAIEADAAELSNEMAEDAAENSSQEAEIDTFDEDASDTTFELEPKSSHESIRTPFENPLEDTTSQESATNTDSGSPEIEEGAGQNESESTKIAPGEESGLELSMTETVSSPLSPEETKGAEQQGTALDSSNKALEERVETVPREENDSNEQQAGKLEPKVGEEILPEDDEDEKTAALFAIPQPKAEEESNESGASQEERISAKSVFAAKRAKQKQVRNLRLAGIGIAAMVILGAGFVYFYITNSTSSGITVPDDFVAGQQTFLNEEAVLFEDTTVEETINLDSQNSITVSAEALETQGEIVQINEPNNEEQAELATEEAASVESSEELIAVSSELSPELSPGLSPGLPPAPSLELTPDLTPEITPDSQADAISDSTQSISQVIGGPADVPQNTIVEIEEQTATDTEPQEVATSANPETPLSETPNLAAEESVITDNSIVEANEIVEVEPVNLISFSRRETESTVDPMLANAYIAYQAGDLNSARSFYEQALVSSPLSRDALLGLAAIAVAEDQQIQAMELYSQLLARDPADPVARAGLLDLQPVGRPAEVERELRRLVDMHNDVAPLFYALGNYYASQNEWSGAQSQYFRALQIAKSAALQGQPVNPDYAFNLAVSLEHLNQVSPAQNYYEEALEFAREHPAGFDLAIVRNRLENIERTAAE